MKSGFDKCAVCGRDLSDIIKNEGKDRIPCPDCGSTQRNYFFSEEGVVHNHSLSASVKTRDENGNLKQESRQREDISEKTGEPVIVSIHVDHSDPDKTEVIHTVEKVDKLTGFRQKIHEDKKIGKAKHRSEKS